MNTRTKKPEIYKIKQRFILFLPAAYAEDFNRASTGNNLRIFLSKDMKSGRVIVNEKHLYATMLNTTCINNNNQQASNSPLKVLVCHKEKFKGKSPMINNHFSFKTVVKKKNQNRVLPEDGSHNEVSTSSSFSGEPTGAQSTTEHVTADTSFSN